MQVQIAAIFVRRHSVIEAYVQVHLLASAGAGGDAVTPSEQLLQGAVGHRPSKVVLHLVEVASRTFWYGLGTTMHFILPIKLGIVELSVVILIIIIIIVVVVIAEIDSQGR